MTGQRQRCGCSPSEEESWPPDISECGKVDRITLPLGIPNRESSSNEKNSTRPVRKKREPQSTG